MRCGEIKALVPASDVKLSRRFYQASWFMSECSSADLADGRCGKASFLVQKVYVAAHGENPT